MKTLDDYIKELKTEDLIEGRTYSQSAKPRTIRRSRISTLTLGFTETSLPSTSKCATAAKKQSSHL